MLTAAGLCSGMITVSTARPSWVRNRSFRKPSAEETTECSSSSRGSVPMTSNQAPGDLAIAGPCDGIVNASADNCREQATDEFRANIQGERPLHEDFGSQVTGIDHGQSPKKRPEKPSTFPILSLE